MDFLTLYSLAGVLSSSEFASCWQSSATSGDAQCVAECVGVTAENGTSFYPLVRAETSTKSLTATDCLALGMQSPCKPSDRFL